MPEQGPIQEYLSRLRLELRGAPRLSRRVVEEAADHLREAARAGEVRGLQTEEAEREAVARFGAPADIARLYARESLALRTLGALLRLAAGGSLVVAAWLGSVLLFVLPGRNADQIPFWTVVMLAFAAYAALTWWHVWHPHRAPLRWLLGLGSAAGVAAGAFAVLSMAARARRGQDFEGYIVLMGLTLAGHGALTLAHLFLTRHAPRPPGAA